VLAESTVVDDCLGELETGSLHGVFLSGGMKPPPCGALCTARHSRRSSIEVIGAWARWPLPRTETCVRRVSGQWAVCMCTPVVIQAYGTERE